MPSCFHPTVAFGWRIFNLLESSFVKGYLMGSHAKLIVFLGLGHLDFQILFEILFDIGLFFQPSLLSFLVQLNVLINNNELICRLDF